MTKVKNFIKSDSFYKVILVFLLLLFFLQSLFFALYVREGIFPDEAHHLKPVSYTHLDVYKRQREDIV